MRQDIGWAAALLALCLTTAIPAAEARGSHRHRLHHRHRVIHRSARYGGERTFPVVAGSASVRINSAGQVITDRHP